MRLVALLVVLIAATLFTDASPVPLPLNCAAATHGVWWGAARARAADLPGRGRSLVGTRLPLGHAHNDYEHTHPLFDALHAGFASVEADVWPVDGHLLVAHQRNQVDPSRTLESLYLRPLSRLYRSRPGAPRLQLLVDVKGTPSATLPLLRAELAGHAAILTGYRGCTASPGPVSVVVSGNAHPTAPDPGATSWFGYDQFLEPGDPGDHVAPRRAVTPLVSGDWADWFTWDGHGSMPGDERRRLQQVVASAHAAGSAIRFWDTPDDPGPARDAIWRELAAAGVDYINTDDLAGYADFDRRWSRTAPGPGPG